MQIIFWMMLLSWINTSPIIMISPELRRNVCVNWNCPYSCICITFKCQQHCRLCRKKNRIISGTYGNSTLSRRSTFLVSRTLVLLQSCCSKTSFYSQKTNLHFYRITTCCRTATSMSISHNSLQRLIRFQTFSQLSWRSHWRYWDVLGCHWHLWRWNSFPMRWSNSPSEQGSSIYARRQPSPKSSPAKSGSWYPWKDIASRQPQSSRWLIKRCSFVANAAKVFGLPWKTVHSLHLRFVWLPSELWWKRYHGRSTVYCMR